jgi:protein-S-isoprenylcysteine O-methyltransferase Ste14
MLVITQAAAAAVIVLTTPLALPETAGPIVGVALAVAGGMLGVWSIVVIGTRQLRMSPEPGEDMNLVRHGPYRLIRHPMYAALLLAMLGLVLVDPRWWRATLWAVLLVVLWFKLRHEESMLLAAVPEYDDYMKQTKRLVPGIF